jgi:hypothetical protein
MDRYGTADLCHACAMSSFRSGGSFGKRQEYIAVAELPRHGYDVYMTLVDDQQIDCVVRMEVDSHLVYIDVQIKARSLSNQVLSLRSPSEILAQTSCSCSIRKLLEPTG